MNGRQFSEIIALSPDNVSIVMSSILSDMGIDTDNNYLFEYLMDNGNAIKLDDAMDIDWINKYILAQRQ